eukprot:CAMPEP_0115218354 /NCGR_PEP_ID=MMETSP0270-20121206/26352_1 /TAXON_ID=71861 /ORGANISM="Scrippsiella trochoidea, Strain CCMP3099" /LENGTH=47 /DNA_ID= /DNA_START= /DNA_END= /DNA_ORIENTATION=
MVGGSSCCPPSHPADMPSIGRAMLPVFDKELAKAAGGWTRAQASAFE